MVFAIASVLVPILAGLVDAWDAWWAARDDPTWETRWRSLDQAESSWLAVIATSRGWIATLTDPEEIRLAKGRRGRESRRRLKFDLAALPVFIAAAALTLAEVLNEQILVAILLLFGVVRPLWVYRRERRIKAALQAQREVAAATGV